MPEPLPHRRGRGLHPQDISLFLNERAATLLHTAAFDLAWLLERGYAVEAALKLVGDRHALRKRQRMALLRSVCAPGRAVARRACCVAPAALRGQPLLVDGLNQLITTEVAFSGGILLRGNDGALRDLASVHGTYRLVRESPRAVDALGAWLAGAGAGPVAWLLDAPVSNTDRLAALLRARAAHHGWPWEVRLVRSADPVLRVATGLVATSDGGVLDAGVAWVDLAGAVVASTLPRAHVVQPLSAE